MTASGSADIFDHLQLRAAYPGRVTLPGDADYDPARAVFYGWVDKRPAAIIRVVNEGEVARVIKLARQSGLDLAVRSGGHSNAGYGVCDGIVLDLSKMRGLEINVEGLTAWAQSGLTAGEYTTAAAAHGLATGFGDTGSVGIGGLTLGGGVGYLVRKHGLTIDDLLAVDLVTAEGELIEVNADSHPDLFWALRGGGGNFGVATRFKFRMHKLDSVFGGLLILSATAESISAFIAAAEAAPEELSAIANVMPAPPLPFLPTELHGQLVIFAMIIYAGDSEAGELAIAPFRAIAKPLADLIKTMPYAEIYAGQDGPHPVAGEARTLFVNKIDAGVAEKILHHLNESDALIRVAQLRVLGGAMARVPVEASAFAHRQSRIMVNVACLYENLDDKTSHEGWVNRFAADLHQGDDGAYVNFLGEEGPARVRAAYPGATWERLAWIKQQYDPTNLFHVNQNIPPAGSESK
jgi:FAD/FMN-containing dehydrogenase